MTTSNLNDPLPPSYGPNIPKEAATKYIKDFLKELLPITDVNQVDSEENWRFPLEKIGEEKKRKQKPRKRKLLTRNEKKNLGLLKLPKDGWDYSNIVPMNKMWCEYMHENLELAKKAPHHTEAEYNSFCAILNKS
ncbi:hypothetical protein AMK59_4951 [Oryctes borbonicus]|uniref:Uncharacterized protein n=1 Tax=Oryctes borbonicus TaxID=1629725 RepID=A0A0T6B4A1_9SCAR|nr:hypothetical protein AMK59_4951 [Oryctes borbonicus]